MKPGVDIRQQIADICRGVTKAQLADAMQIDPSEASRLINGTRNFRIDTLEKLCFVLGYEVRLVKIPKDT